MKVFLSSADVKLVVFTFQEWKFLRFRHETVFMNSSFLKNVGIDECMH
jgi:hypothetical protein